MKKTILVLFLCFNLVFTTCPVCLAEEICVDNPLEEEPLYIRVLFTNTIQIRQGEYYATIEIDDNKITVRDSIMETPLIITFLENGIHSSVTGNIVYDSSVGRQQESMLNTSEMVDGTRANTWTPTGDYRTQWYSYAQIKAITGENATLAGIAAAIFGFLSRTFPMLSTTATILTAISVIGGVVSLVVQGSTSHGIRIRIQKYKLISEKYNETGVFYKWKVLSASSY